MRAEGTKYVHAEEGSATAVETAAAAAATQPVNQRASMLCCAACRRVAAAEACCVLHMYRRSPPSSSSSPALPPPPLPHLRSYQVQLLSNDNTPRPDCGLGAPPCHAPASSQAVQLTQNTQTSSDEGRYDGDARDESTLEFLLCESYLPYLPPYLPAYLPAYLPT